MDMIVSVLGRSTRATEVDPLTGAVTAEPRDRGRHPCDLAALEQALRLSERWDVRVVAVAIGPPEADATLREALAAGAAEVLRVEPVSGAGSTGSTGSTGAIGATGTGSAGSADPSGMVDGGQESAAALAEALRRRYGVPDLLLCGDAPADDATGSFAAFLAAELNAEQALGVVHIEPDGADALRVQRRLDGGRREVLRVRRPAVVSVEAAGVRLRRAGLRAVLAGRQAHVPTMTTTAVTTASTATGVRPPRVLGAQPYRPRPRTLPGPHGTAHLRVLELTGALVERTPPTVVGPLAPEAAVEELLGYLHRHGCLGEDGTP
ncbi:mycofactocin-associated electron transfer flavoprotein beta subunit [Streptomyces sp. NPDC005355]|uniref:mycofactocin-associated electron transfer flavoprotein beta subunit n=1 Tax=Streptomyces sp. NPDC005355 TaxID=3157038 RepID=UPI0033A92BBF